MWPAASSNWGNTQWFPLLPLIDFVTDSPQVHGFPPVSNKSKNKNLILVSSAVSELVGFIQKGIIYTGSVKPWLAYIKRHSGFLEKNNKEF